MTPSQSKSFINWALSFHCMRLTLELERYGKRFVPQAENSLMNGELRPTLP